MPVFPARPTKIENIFRFVDQDDARRQLTNPEEQTEEVRRAFRSGSLGLCTRDAIAGFVTAAVAVLLVLLLLALALVPRSANMAAVAAVAAAAPPCALTSCASYGSFAEAQAHCANRSGACVVNRSAAAPAARRRLTVASTAPCLPRAIDTNDPLIVYVSLSGAGGDIYVLNGVTSEFSVGAGVHWFTNIPSSHPMAITDEST